MKIMNFLFLIVTLLLGGIHLQAQTHSVAFDVMGYTGLDQGVMISALDDGLLIGSTAICDQSSGAGCFAIIKTDFEGNEQWRFIHDDNLPYEIDPSPFAPVIKENGNLLIAGGNWHDNETYGHVAYLMELDSMGNVIWKREYGQQSYFHGVKLLESGQLLCYGIHWSEGYKKRYFVKTDMEGVVIQEEILPLLDNSWYNKSYGLEVLENGNILQMVETKITNRQPSGETLVLMDSAYNTIQSRLFYQQYLTMRVPEIALQRHDGGYVTQLVSDSITPIVLGEADGFDDLVIGLDSMFNTEWMLLFPAWGGKVIYRLILAQNGDIIGCGYDNTLIHEDDDYSAGWIFRISPQGELLWERQYYMSEHFEWDGVFPLESIVELPDGRLAATGWRLDRRKDGTINGNVWLLITDENGCLSEGCDDETVWVTAVEEVEEEQIQTSS